MLSYFDALSTIEDNFSKFNDWVLYLNNELNQHLPNQKDRISVFTVVFKKECDDLIFDCFSNMKKYTNKAAAQHKDDSVYSNIHNIDSLFVKLNAHESKFDLASVKAVFKTHNIIWNEKEFKLLKESSNVAISILQSYFEKHLPDYFNTSKEYLSQENRDNLLEYTKTPFIKGIVTSILNNEPLVLESTQTALIQKPTKAFLNSPPSFKVNIEQHEKYDPKKKGLIQQAIDTDLKDMMNSLISKKYIDSETKAKTFLKIFSGTEVNEKVVWIDGRNHLKYFIENLYDKKLVPIKGRHIWIVAFKCFDLIDMVGNTDEKVFSKLVRQAETISKTDVSQLNACINHLHSIK